MLEIYIVAVFVLYAMTYELFFKKEKKKSEEEKLGEALVKYLEKGIKMRQE